MTDPPKTPDKMRLLAAASKARRDGVPQADIDAALQGRIGMDYAGLTTSIKDDNVRGMKGLGASFLTGASAGLANLIPGVKATRKEFAADYPVISGAADLVGGLAIPGMGALKFLKGVKAATPLGKAAMRAPGLIGLGAVEGASRAEPGDRLLGAGIGGTVGAVTAGLPAAAGFAAELPVAKQVVKAFRKLTTGTDPYSLAKARIQAKAKAAGVVLSKSQVEEAAISDLAARQAKVRSMAGLTPTAPPAPTLPNGQPLPVGRSAEGQAMLDRMQSRAPSPDRLQKIKPMDGLLGGPQPTSGILAPPREIGSPYSGVLGRTSGPSPSPEVMASFGEELAARDAAKAAARAEDFAHVSGPGMGRSPAGHKIVPPADAMEQSAAYYRALEQRPITPMPIRETPVTPLRPDSPLEKIAKRAKAETETAERVQAGVTKAHLAADQSRMVERFKGYTDEQLRGVVNKSGFDSAKEAAKAELASRGTAPGRSLQ